MWIEESRVIPEGNPTDWISANVFGSSGSLTFNVPQVFESYCRILHRPASDQNSVPIRWSTIADDTGSVVHPSVQWHRLIGRTNVGDLYTEWRGYRPRLGQLDFGSFSSLLESLLEFDRGSDEAIFGFWKGYFDMQPGGAAGVTATEFGSERFVVSGRELLLFEGRLHALRDQIVHRPSSVRRLPGCMWPVNHSWYMHSDVDFDSTLVGGPKSLIDSIINDTSLEAMVISADIDLSFLGDTVN